MPGTKYNQTRGKLTHWCDECGQGFVTRDDLHTHEIDCGWQDREEPIILEAK